MKPGITARPTTYRGTPMRSRLEAHWARQFDLAGFDWTVGPELDFYKNNPDHIGRTLP